MENVEQPTTDTPTQESAVSEDESAEILPPADSEAAEELAPATETEVTPESSQAVEDSSPAAPEEAADQTSSTPDSETPPYEPQESPVPHDIDEPHEEDLSPALYGSEEDNLALNEDTPPGLLPAMDVVNAQQQLDIRVLEETQANLSHQIFDLSERISSLSSSNTAIITDLHRIAEESEHLTHWSQHVQVTSALSKVFQVISICVLLALLGGIIWLAVLQSNTQARLNTTEATLAEALKLQQKRLADYDKHFAELVGKELQTELETTHKTTLQEQLNKLRGGSAEQRIYRRNSGDWFVVSGKSEQHVVDPDIIEALNQAFVRSGKQLVTRSPMPPHKVWGLLKSNGHGGTDIIITSEISP